MFMKVHGVVALNHVQKLQGISVSATLYNIDSHYIACFYIIIDSKQGTSGMQNERSGFHHNVSRREEGDDILAEGNL